VAASRGNSELVQSLLLKGAATDLPRGQGASDSKTAFYGLHSSLQPAALALLAAANGPVVDSSRNNDENEDVGLHAEFEIERKLERFEKGDLVAVWSQLRRAGTVEAQVSVGKVTSASSSSSYPPSSFSPEEKSYRVCFDDNKSSSVVPASAIQSAVGTVSTKKGILRGAAAPVLSVGHRVVVVESGNGWERRLGRVRYGPGSGGLYVVRFDDGSDSPYYKADQMVIQIHVFYSCCTWALIFCSCIFFGIIHTCAVCF
jgi:hypothetical protein